MVHIMTHLPGDSDVCLVVDAPPTERATASKACASHWIAGQAVNDRIRRHLANTVDQAILLVEEQTQGSVYMLNVHHESK